MEVETKEYLKSLFTYLKMMDRINKKLKSLIKNNIKNTPEQNTELFYELVTEIMRIIPYSYDQDKDELCFKNNDGILMLRDKLPFIKDDYNKIIKKESLKEALINIIKVRNKFTHEPHNLSFSFSVGGKTSCSVGIYYKDNMQYLSTIDIEVIVKELNIIYEKIRKEFISIVNRYDKEYKKCPIYKSVLSFRFKKYNENITILPKYFGN